VNTKVINMYR